jgi:hypothetical protein
MKTLNIRNIDDLLAGSSWFSTGGGFPRDRAKAIFNQVLKKSRLRLKNLAEFKDDEYLCVASGVGSIKNTDVNIGKSSSKALKILEEMVGHKIKGIVSGEIGLECLAADTAVKLRLPIVDADMKGGRAAPEPSINMFNLADQSVLPAVAINTHGDIAILKNVKNQQKIEIFLRHFANMAHGCFVVWCPRPARQFKKLLVSGTISRTIDLGEMIKKSTNLNRILKKISGKKLFEGIISNIKDETGRGFLLRTLTVKNGKNLCQIWIKNENLAVLINDKIILTCPDLITVIDEETNLGIHNSKMIIGQKMTVIGIPHHKKWHSKRGYEIFGPKHFGLPFKLKRL